MNRSQPVTSSPFARTMVEAFHEGISSAYGHPPPPRSCREIKRAIGPRDCICVAVGSLTGSGAWRSPVSIYRSKSSVSPAAEAKHKCFINTVEGKEFDFTRDVRVKSYSKARSHNVLAQKKSPNAPTNPRKVPQKHSTSFRVQTGLISRF